jgi:hypothetical protein
MELGATMVINTFGENPAQSVNKNDVKFLVSYKDGYRGVRHWPNGAEIVTSRECGADFERRGLGRMLEVNTDDPASNPADESEVNEPKPKRGRKPKDAD